MKEVVLDSNSFLECDKIIYESKNIDHLIKFAHCRLPNPIIYHLPNYSDDFYLNANIELNSVEIVDLRNSNLQTFPKYLSLLSPNSLKRWNILDNIPLLPEIKRFGVLCMSPIQLICVLSALQQAKQTGHLNLSNTFLTNEKANLLHFLESDENFWNHIEIVDLRGNENLSILPLFLGKLQIEKIVTLIQLNQLLINLLLIFMD